MQDTHNELSPKELSIISDTEFFRMKNDVTHKIEGSLAVLGENISALLQNYADALPKDVLRIAPKISRGEQYKNLPWLILDYPRVFSGEDAYAFRSMFWWGNYFSFTIHLAGKYFKPVKRKLADNISMLNNKDFYLCKSTDPWQHHFEKTNYVKLDELSEEEISCILKEADFIKLARKMPLKTFSKMTEYGTETYKGFMEIVY